ncbi:MAG: hypothetical protein H7175_21640 [Burkholderiales bacterium]|nr:hypothetical protein [Anaerolineae bacterium]
MQISRHWRLKPQRYRLEGVRYENGEVCLQERPTAPVSRERQPETTNVQRPETIVVAR